jgi:cysteine-rich repeat protein
MDDTDACTNLCQNAICGDTVVQLDVEQCDDGNMDDTDACTTGCLNAECGDTFVYTDVEQCDDGNDIDTDACTLGCIAASCGDSIVYEDVEDCDDANLDNTDSCTNLCEAAACGDGFVQMGEQCDDGDVDAGDGCSATCQFEYKYVFVSSTLHTGNMGGLAGADTICNNLAQAANLPGTYMAWISVVGTTPATRFTQSTVPYMLVDDVSVVANNWADLVNGSLDLAIARTELDTLTPNTAVSCENSVRLVRTGTNSNGTQGPNLCYNFTSAVMASLGTAGRTTSLTGTWSNCAPVACDVLLPIYCFQQ